ncbi:MAG: hypothetical protein IK095_04395, partial [Oscillospiraceae bacterium]|nr:hypothetical protein [Oscillospiraceae bacterium]
AFAQTPLDIRGEGQPAEMELSLYMAPCPDEEGPVLWLRCGDRELAFPGPAAEEAVMWALILLAKDEPSLQGKSLLKLRVETYSASQQALAAKLLASSDFWQHSLSAEALPKVMEETLQRSVRQLEEYVPAFTDRPFCNTGKEKVRRSLDLFARERQIKLEELAEELYGTHRFEDTLNAWIARTGKTPAFQQAMVQARDRIAEALFHLPMMEVPVRLRDAVQELARRHDPKGELEKARNAQRAKVSVRHLSADTIEDKFKGVNELYRSAAREMLCGAMLEPVAAWLRARVDEQMPTALRTLQDWDRSLRDFCKLSESGERVKIGWDRCGELKDEELSVAEDGWTAAMLRDLYTNAGIRNSYYVMAWICSQASCEEAKKSIDQMVREIVPLQGMTEQLVVALMQRPIQVPRR